MKTQKGITLIALIITIVVLLILAVVAIGAAQDSNIVGYAQNAASEYETGKGKENNAISDMEALLNKYSTGGNSAGNSNGSNNGGTNDNPSGGNNGGTPEGGTDEPEITPPEVEEPDPTPPEPVYYSKTLNTNQTAFEQALDLPPDQSLINHKMVYVSGNAKINITMGYHMGLPYYSKIYVRYINEEGNTFNYAICKKEYSIDELKEYFYAQDYVEPGAWTQYKGKKYNMDNGTEPGLIYETITELPVFEGEWQIDEANTTAGGKQYLSNVLIDVTN